MIQVGYFRASVLYAIVGGARHHMLTVGEENGSLQGNPGGVM